jgi:MFS family permease
MLALNETFGTAAAVRLHAPNWLIPLMGSLPILLGAAGQFLLPRFANSAKGRKHYVLIGVHLQALGFFLCGYTGFLPEPIAAYGFVALFALAGLFGNLTGAFWMSWMADLVPAAVRGRHFAWRNVFFAWSNLAVSLTAGLIARRFDTHTAPWIFFAAVFSVSGLLRYASYQAMRRQFEPPPSPEMPATPLHLVHRLQLPSGFAFYALSSALFQGAANIAGPFFAVWYLRDLHFNYFNLAIATSCTVIGSILALRFWGALADRKGHSHVLRLSGLLIVLVPWPYLFIRDPLLIFVMNLYGGACWAGYNLANFNRMLEVSGQERKSQVIAFFTLINGVSLTFFGVLAGFLADRVPQLFDAPLQSMFLISGVLRFAVWALFLRRLR